jgi:hypothetical protein
MPVALEARVAAIWAVLRANDQDAGCIDFDNPEAVRELLEGGVPPPPGDVCKLAAAYAVELRDAQERARAALDDVDAIIAEMETCTPPGSSGGGNGGNGNGGEPGNDLEGVKVVGVESGWDVTRYEVAGTISSVEVGIERIDAEWPDMGPEYPDGDFGPFDPGEVHCGRLYLVARVDGELKTWGIEWLRRLANEHRGTTVHRWVEDGLTLFQTLAAKAKGNGVPADWLPVGLVGFYYASPLVEKRSNIVWVDVPR